MQYTISGSAWDRFKEKGGFHAIMMLSVSGTTVILETEFRTPV